MNDYYHCEMTPRRKQWISRIRWLICIFIIFLLLLLHWREYVLNEEVGKLQDLIRLFPRGKPLIYITTREGLTSRYQQLERMHSNALRSNRSILVLDNYSVHYKDLGKICLCNIFELPPTITCSSAPIDRVVEVFKCTLPHVPKQYENPNQYKASNFGLKDLSKVNKLEPFTWDKTICTLAYGFYFNETKTNHIIPIRFKEPYVTLYVDAYRSIIESTKLSIVDKRKPLLVVVHWRRGDQAGRCRTLEDTSVNCGSVEAFITKVRNETTSYLGIAHSFNMPNHVVTYVATNERDPAVLRKLEASGYKLFKHSKWRSSGRVDSLTAFVVELQLMIHADVFLGWGTTGIGYFVRRARAELILAKT